MQYQGTLDKISSVFFISFFFSDLFMWSSIKLLKQREMALLARAIQSNLGPVILKWKVSPAALIFKLLCKCRDYFLHYSFFLLHISFSIRTGHWNEIVQLVQLAQELGCPEPAQSSGAGVGQAGTLGTWQRSCHCLSPTHPHCHPQSSSISPWYRPRILNYSRPGTGKCFCFHVKNSLVTSNHFLK